MLRKRPGTCAATRTEQVLIERVMGAKNGDALTIDLPPALYASETLKALDARLGMKLRATRVR